MDINPTYNNDVRCAEMIAQIAEDIRDKLAQTIQDAHYLSVPDWTEKWIAFGASVNMGIHMVE